MSPYNYVGGNPIVNVDPNGMSIDTGRSAIMPYDTEIDLGSMFSGISAPVYSPGGDFLGTDDEELQGLPIIMEEEEFKQGMSHEKAKNKDLRLAALNGGKAWRRFLKSYTRLDEG